MADSFLIQRLETRPDIPSSGRFLLPICLDRDELIALFSSVERFNRFVGDWENPSWLPLLQAIEFIGRPEMALCFNEEYESYDCLEYPAFASFIEYVPQDPWDEEAEVPPNYLTYPWWKWSKLETLMPDFIDDFLAGIIEQITQYKPNDALTWIGGLPYNGIGEIIDNGFAFPYIKIHVSGKGRARLNFLSFPLGGRVIVEVDEMPNILDIITNSLIDPDSRVSDLARDIDTFPMEQNPAIGINVDIAEEGEHVIYCMMLPKVEVGIDFFGFGGGLRSVELCGGLRPSGTPAPAPAPDLEGVTELTPEFQFTPECGFEYRLKSQTGSIVLDWTPVSGWDVNSLLCFGGGEVATIEEICEGVICALEKSASRFLSGVAGNIEGGVIIGTDGTITVGGTDAPADDPATEWDETEAAIMGAAINISKAIEVFLDKLDNYYGATNGTPVTPAATTKVNLAIYFPVDETLLDAAVTEYYAYRATEPRFLFDTSETQQNVMYCQGINRTGWNKWLIDYSGFNNYKLATVAGLTNSLSDKFWEDYASAGLKLPSTQYLDAPCVPIKSQTLEGFTFDVQRATTIVKANHRMRIKLEGYATDADGDIQDWLWFRTIAGVNTWTPATFVHSAGNNLPSQTEVPYNSSHIYEYTIDLQNLAGQPMLIDVNKNASFNAVGMTQNAPFKITLTDLGQHTII